MLDRALNSVDSNPDLYECFLKRVAATGKGSRSPVLTEGQYDPDRSRRVEVKIRVRSTEQQFKSMVNDEAIAPARAEAEAAPAGPAPAPSPAEPPSER